MKVGLFFGSFNPIHIGHLIVANHFLEFSDLEEIWFVVSPQNPLKKDQSLLDANFRLKMVKAALNSNEKFKCCEVEFNLPTPSYTINTLTYLRKKYPWLDFTLIMGSDSIELFDEWMDYKDILTSFPIYVYPRREHPAKNWKTKKNVTFYDFPYLDISATYIRECLRQKKSVQYMVPDRVFAVLQKEAVK